MIDEIRDYNKELHYGLDLLHKGTYNKCLFEDDCTEPTISAHSISRAVLKTIQCNGKVITPNTRTSKDDSGRSHLNLTFTPEVTTRASTGRFSCQAHDSLFDIIDANRIDFDNPKVLNLLYYRAILRETWTLSKSRTGTTYQESKGPSPTPSSIHPDTRLKALHDSISSIKPFLDRTDCPLTHIVRHVSTARPILTASCAGGSAIRVNGIDRSVSWAFSVLPQTREHVVVASYLKNSVAETYFSHFGKTNGRELQAAISAELIYFGENWFLHPKVWAAYGKTRREAIADAFNNVEELLMGKYRELYTILPLDPFRPEPRPSAS